MFKNVLGKIVRLNYLVPEKTRHIIIKKYCCPVKIYLHSKGLLKRTRVRGG